MVQQNMVYVPYFGGWPMLSCLPSPAITASFPASFASRPGSLANTLQLKEPANVFDDRSMLDNGKQGHPCAGTQVRSCLWMSQNKEWQKLAANFLLGTFQA